MRVLVFGKGGSGKSTVVALLAKALVKHGFKVLVVDSDESNMTLHRMIGVDAAPSTLTDYLGGRRRVVEALFKCKSEIDWSFTEKGISGLPRECVTWQGRLGLLVVGKVSGFGEGCACPLNALTREFLRKVKMSSSEMIIVDTDAGVEHFGRGVEEACDLLLMVVDPTFESLVMAERAEKFAREVGKPLYYVLNKVDEKSRDLLIERIPRDKVLALLCYCNDWIMKSLKGEPLGEPPPEIEKLASFLIERSYALPSISSEPGNHTPSEG